MEKIIQITSGRGPAECCWVVAQILKIIIKEASTNNLNYTILHREEGIESRTLYSVTIQLDGTNVNNFIKQWAGTIQWIGQSEYRKYNKRKNWYVAINELQFVKEIIQITDRDIAYQAIRSGGPGGQHVNKVSTAIRATHIPTGLQVVSSESRSQLQNKKLAKERLFQLLKLEQVNQKKALVKENWQNHNEIVRGNPIKTFVGSDFKVQKNNRNYKSRRLSLKNEVRDILSKE
ncbi:peptide chain release factor H [Carboxylicivirga sp. N1Y90]|uniref:peptide chain release factor H n=1 Tax=Carboxylicivirga fragile TaxID=3417571 RepID=UPI003D334D81|nr:peptide chain release factor H [Marinilabiliaceae bacterium N1Y90]